MHDAVGSVGGTLSSPSKASLFSMRSLLPSGVARTGRKAPPRFRGSVVPTDPSAAPEHLPPLPWLRIGARRELS